MFGLSLKRVIRRLKVCKNDFIWPFFWDEESFMCWILGRVIPVFKTFLAHPNFMQIFLVKQNATLIYRPKGGRRP